METFKITTDETLRETIQHGNNRYPFAYYPDNIWKFDFHRIDWHWHHELEFLYTAEGTALCLIGTSKIELHKGCGIGIYQQKWSFTHFSNWHPLFSGSISNSIQTSTGC